MAADWLGMSRQRLHQLIKDGRFVDLVLVPPFKHYLSIKELEAFAKIKRSKTGAFRYG